MFEKKRTCGYKIFVTDIFFQRCMTGLACARAMARAAAVRKDWEKKSDFQNSNRCRTLTTTNRWCPPPGIAIYNRNKRTNTSSSLHRQYRSQPVPSAAPWALGTPLLSPCEWTMCWCHDGGNLKSPFEYFEHISKDLLITMHESTY